jgi:hypothetical protein
MNHRPVRHSDRIHTTHPFTPAFIEITARRIGHSTPGSRVAMIAKDFGTYAMKILRQEKILRDHDAECRDNSKKSRMSTP